MKRIREALLRLPRGSWKERGQAMTELALAMIVLVMLMSIVLDLGRAFFTYLALQNAAGEGAYYGSAFPDNVGEKGTTDKDTIIYRAQNESPVTAELINWQEAEFDVSYPVSGEARRGEPILVTITYNFDFVGPIPHLFGLNDMTLSAQAWQTTLSSTAADQSSPAPTATPDPATAHIWKYNGTDIRGSSGNKWYGSITVWIHKLDETVAPGIDVTGRWIYEDGTQVTVTCKTGSGGSCQMPPSEELSGSGTCVYFQVLTPSLDPHSVNTELFDICK